MLQKQVAFKAGRTKPNGMHWFIAKLSRRYQLPFGHGPRSAAGATLCSPVHECHCRAKWTRQPVENIQTNIQTHIQRKG